MAVESSNRAFENIADKVKVGMDQAGKRIFSLLDMDYAYALGRFHARVVQDNNELLRNVARCTALTSTSFYNINGALLVEGVADAADGGSSVPSETSKEVTIDRDGPTV